MNKPHGIIVFGANGSGKTTLGRELARILNFKHMDHEAYAFNESDIPYANPRSDEECIELMLADIEKHRSFVLSAVIGDFGDNIIQFFELAVYISAPFELRMERIKRRSFEQHGERILEGGDMYDSHKNFFAFVASRNLSRIDQWAKTLTCPILRIDGTVDWRVNAANIADKFCNVKTAKWHNTSYIEE